MILFRDNMENDEKGKEKREQVTGKEISIPPYIAVYLHDWLNLIIENDKVCENTSCQTQVFHSREIVQFIFNICEKFKFHPHVKYHATDLFNVFMETHLKELYNTVRDRARSNQELKHDWNSVLDKVKKQLTLRIISCAYLSEKLERSCSRTSTEALKQFLDKSGCSYSKADLLKSEIRVLKTLNSKISQNSCFTKIETLLEILAYNDRNFKVESIFKNSLKVLDYFYIERLGIYRHLRKALCVENEDISDVKFRKVENNILLISVCMISCAQYLDDMNRYRKVCEQLANICNISTDDILIFCGVFIKHFTD